MNILVILGGPRRGQTYKYVTIFEKSLKSFANFNFQYLMLKDYSLAQCKGCAICLEQGEEFCSLKDNRDEIIKKMMEADGIIFAAPNFALQVPAVMKNFFDRLAFVFHRPCFFHKASIAIITQGVYGGKEILNYINTVCEFWGFNTLKGIALTTPWGVSNPSLLPPEKDLRKIEVAIEKAAKGFYKTLVKESSPEPSLKRLLLFRMTRSYHRTSANRQCDYKYFEKKGWLTSPYFYETKLRWYKGLLGNLIDRWQQKGK